MDKAVNYLVEDEKMDFIESLPEGDAMVIIWFKLLALAGKCNTADIYFLQKMYLIRLICFHINLIDQLM